LQELTRANKSVFLLGFHARVSKVLAKHPWYPRMICFPDYGTLLIHLRNILRLEDEQRRTAGNKSFAEFVAEKSAAGTLLSPFTHKGRLQTDNSDDSDTDDDDAPQHKESSRSANGGGRRSSIHAMSASAAMAVLAMNSQSPVHGSSASSNILSPVQEHRLSAASSAQPETAPVAVSIASAPAAAHESSADAVWDSTAPTSTSASASGSGVGLTSTAPSAFDKQWE
jgi:hypothetical protein